MLFLFLARRCGGRPVLSGLLLMVCGIALVAIWALSGGGPGAAQLARFGILGTLAGAALAVRGAYRSRREPPAAPPGDQNTDANHR